MGTITTRKRSDGTYGHTAQIRLKKDGKIHFTESQTFDRKPAASAWLKKRETELAKPGALEQAKIEDPTLADVIDKYNEEKRKDHGKTKAQVLNAIKAAAIGSMKCSEIESKHIITFAQSLHVQPQTVGNYLSHMASMFTVARPAWGYPLDKQAIDDARVVAQKMGITSRSNQRDRRPTLDELEKILRHFKISKHKRVDAIPMVDVLLFAIFSCRRLEEITRIAWEDLDQEHMEMIVRDMKHPGEKVGNDVRVEVPLRAMTVILRQSTRKGRIFPFNGESISTNFTRACKILGVDNLHFHDMRHEGISHLFELGKNIPQVAIVSGHRSWTSLKRYSHIRQAGDKYAKWEWLPS
jgi:integrase